MPEQIEVDGRGLSVPVVTLDAFSDRVVIRVDDDNAPEFWLTLELTIPNLAKLLQAVIVARGPANRVALAALERLAASLHCFDY